LHPLFVSIRASGLHSVMAMVFGSEYFEGCMQSYKRTVCRQL
jgi:hypothetical protein